MYCQHCGATMAKGSGMCGSCGRPVGIPLVPISTSVGNSLSGGWSGVVMTVLVIATLIIPIVGVIAGFVGLGRAETRSQGAALFGIAAISMIVNVILMLALMSA